jgi:hypothetical protein
MLIKHTCNPISDSKGWWECTVTCINTTFHHIISHMQNCLFSINLIFSHPTLGLLGPSLPTKEFGNHCVHTLISNHKLGIESGRHSGIPAINRISHIVMKLMTNTILYLIVLGLIHHGIICFKTLKSILQTAIFPILSDCQRLYHQIKKAYMYYLHDLGGRTVVSARSNFFTADTTVVPPPPPHSINLGGTYACTRISEIPPLVGNIWVLMTPPYVGNMDHFTTLVFWVPSDYNFSLIGLMSNLRIKNYGVMSLQGP